MLLQPHLIFPRMYSRSRLPNLKYIEAGRLLSFDCSLIRVQYLNVCWAPFRAMSARAREWRKDYRTRDEVAAYSRRREDRDADRQQDNSQAQVTTTDPANPGHQSRATDTYAEDSYLPSQASVTYPADLSYPSQPTSASSSPQPSYSNRDQIYEGTWGSGTRGMPMSSTHYASAEEQYGYRGAYAASARMHQDREDRDWICVRLLTTSRPEHFLTLTVIVSAQGSF
jgi:hypothetical protein